MYCYGDELYGLEHNMPNIRNLIDRQALHCNKISFIHPITNKYTEFISKLPTDMEHLF
jgi:23S rRNA pseudouridine1911/1915/1917 synthase